MGAFLALIVIVLLALLVVRIGTNALLLTGVSHSAASFQSASAFFGVGFTTAEAEMVVNHPVRRRIILHLIIAGNVGLTSAAATLVLSFVKNSEDGVGPLFLGILLLAVGVLAVGFLFKLPFVSEPLDRMMRRSLEKAGLRKAVDFELLLNLRDGYAVCDFMLEKSHPWAGKPLKATRPSDVGIVVLSIERKDGRFIGAPDKDVSLVAGDTVTVYGAESAVHAVLEGVFSMGSLGS